MWLREGDKLILTLLANSAKLSSIPENISIQYESYLGDRNFIVNDLPSKVHDRRRREKMRTLVMMDSECLLAKNSE